MIWGNSGLLVSQLVVSKSHEMFHLLMILMFFNLVLGSCCYKVRAWYNIKNNAWHQNQFGRFGYYTLRPGTINGKAHYTSDDDGKAAIWWEGGRWRVGFTKDVGTNVCSLYVDSNADCPYTPRSYTWRYYDQYGNWRDAYKGFSIWCISNPEIFHT